MNIVIDTNVIASAIFFGGKPQRFLQLAIDKKFESYISEQIMTEYKRIVDEVSEKYSERQKLFSLEDIIKSCNFTYPTRKITVCRDPDDDKFIECAVEAKCIYIVSGDKDLLSIEKFEDVEIVTVAEFFERYGE